MRKISLLFFFAILLFSTFSYAFSCCTCTPSAGPSNPVYLRLMQGAARRNIQKATELTTKAEVMLQDAKAAGKDVASIETSILEAKGLIEKAKTSLANPIAANNFALKAIRFLKTALLNLGG